MKKTDKKIDHAIRLALTDVCEQALKDVVGFEWLTHQVNYQHFPQSLTVICVFDINENLALYEKSSQKKLLEALIIKALSQLNISVKHCKNLIDYDTEENCSAHHQGNWAKRLA